MLRDFLLRFLLLAQFKKQRLPQDLLILEILHQPKLFFTLRCLHMGINLFKFDEFLRALELEMLSLVDNALILLIQQQKIIAGF